ncbi:4'-phosphopantetheinyl transferase superfamily protein [uncultured Clostridium sp.]|uniref:4'-phosphopantetheinyl transferase family protein n=1 Tax=uncultured Clostridium sp. TaxID=59620 RepID=UPI0025E3EB50|nr:4'-phosphopantetheinyl transferase superfamily protein [uncultured Clostridium sp.]
MSYGNVFIFDISDVKQNDYEYIKSFLDYRTIERLRRYKRFKDKVKSSVGEYIARKACAKYVCKDIKELQISFNEYGKPYFRNADNFKFNISHSGRYVVCAVSEKEIGIDIQKHIDLDEGCSRLFLSKSEVEERNHLDADSKKDYEITAWVYKESYSKFKGKGLYIPYTEITLVKDNGVIIDDRGLDRCVFYEKRFKQGYTMVVTCHENIELNYVRLNKDFIIKEI